MRLNKFYIIFLLLILFSSCSKEEEVKKSVIKEKSLDLQVLESYQKGMESLKSGDVLFAAKKFNETEILFPQSDWAPKSALMAAYSYYTQDYYGDSIAELQRFLKIYPNYKDIDYAYYLLAICYYEQIVDEKKDSKSIINARDTLNLITKKFPETEYAIDAKFKLDLVNNILASKEMYIGRYYLDKKKWISAINRFRTVIDNYETTIYAEEALHRLVEIYYIIGFTKEAKKYAKLLGYNYQSSRWYKESFIVFNKDYKKDMEIKIKKDKKNNISILNKFRSLFE